MKITNKTLHVIMEHDVTLGHNDSIEATLQHMAFISENKDGDVVVDLDFADILNVKFMGMPIEPGYESFKKFKNTMSGLGIDVNKLFDEKAAQLIDDEQMNQIKSLYKQTVNG